MKKYAIIEGADVRPKDINEARLLDRMVYDEDYYVTLEQCLEWNSRNNRIYTMLRDEETHKIIAYVNLSPITDEYYGKIRSGHFIDTYLPAEAIVEYSMPDTYSLYFTSIVIHPDYQNTAVFLELFNAITRKIIKLGEEEILFGRMIADAVSDKGVKFCEMFGMEKFLDSDHGSEIYEVQMLPPKFRVSSRATRELFKFYETAAAELGFAASTEAAAPERAKKESRVDAAHPSGRNHVFISYSSNEAKVAGQVCEYLEQNGVPCWIAPRNINPGDNYPTQIVHAIRDCSILILLASNSTNASGHVSNEISLAFDSKKLIIPFKIEDVAFSDEYLYFLGRKHWIEAHRDMNAGLIQLLMTVKNQLGAPSLSVTPKEPVYRAGRGAPAPQEQALDKPVGIAQADCSRAEIADKILARADKYSGGQLSSFERSGSFEQRKKYADNFLSMSYAVYRYNKPVKVESYPDYLVNEICGDDDSEVIKISGLPGSAKSVLMQTAFYQALQKFKDGVSNCVPFYMALGYYERVQYSGSSIADQVKALMTKELADFFSYIDKHPDVTPVLFVDEIREHSIGKTALENILMSILKPHNIRKRVVAIDTGLVKNRNRVKRVIPIVSEKVSAWFDAKMVDAHDEVKAIKFIENVLAFHDCDILPEEVYRTLKSLKYQELDIFIVRSVANEMTSSIDELSSLSDMYEKWALSELYGDVERLYEISKMTFDYMFKKDLRLEDADFNSPQWALIHKHRSFVDLLVSYYIIKEFEQCEEEGRFNCDLFEIMLTSSTDMFAAAFLSDNYYLQEKLLKAVIRQYDSLDTVQKSSAIFWLAKLTYKNLTSDVVRFLKGKFDEMKPLVKKSDNNAQENYDNQFIFRAVCYALILFEQVSVLDDYLCLLITNGSANEINRGAIIEYYGDTFQMAANDAFNVNADVTEGARAIKALCWKVGAALSPGSKRYPELDLISLAMLLQKRMQDNKSKLNPDIRIWVGDMAAFIKKYQGRPQNVKSEKIEFYIASVYEDFNLFLKNEDFDISQYIYNTLRNMKDTKRRQWTSKNIEDPESVSEHTYSAWMLAMLFLPEELNHEEYSKKEILGMLLIHDMAEARLGDQLLELNEPFKDLKEQNTIMRKLMLKGTYPNIANLTYYYNIWTGYYNGININAKIARDINLIQSVYTFCEYNAKHPGIFTEEEIDHWYSEKQKLETDVGFRVYDILVENNMDFASAGKAPSSSAAPAAATVAKVPGSGALRTPDYYVMSYSDIKSLHGNVDTIKSEIAGIVNSVITSNDSARLDGSLGMLENISENWRVILNRENELVGYWVFIALQEEFFERAKKGSLSEAEITADTMEFIDLPGTYKGYLLLAGTKPEARTAELVQRLYDSLAHHLEYLAERGIFFDEICAVAESPMGNSALKKLGLTEVGIHEFGGKVYLGSLSEISKNKYFSRFGKLKRLYEGFFQR